MSYPHSQDSLAYAAYRLMSQTAHGSSLGLRGYLVVSGDRVMSAPRPGGWEQVLVVTLLQLISVATYTAEFLDEQLQSEVAAMCDSGRDLLKGLGVLGRAG